MYDHLHLPFLPQCQGQLGYHSRTKTHQDPCTQSQSHHCHRWASPTDWRPKRQSHGLELQRELFQASLSHGLQSRTKIIIYVVYLFTGMDRTSLPGLLGKWLELYCQLGSYFLVVQRALRMVLVNDIPHVDRRITTCGKCLKWEIG